MRYHGYYPFVNDLGLPVVTLEDIHKHFKCAAFWVGGCFARTMSEIESNRCLTAPFGRLECRGRAWGKWGKGLGGGEGVCV
jgi:hypothetical protein